MTEEQLLQASKLWVKGLKTKDIAEAIGVSKTNMSYHASKHRGMFPKRPANFYRSSDLRAKNIEHRAKSKISIAKKWPEKAPGHDGVLVGRLTNCGCVFPLWGHHEDFDVNTSLYCGAISEEGHHYCTFHRKLSTGLGTRSERAATTVLAKAA
ncbi:hypothetical protein ACC862_24005 [Rhizobium ruizarguesonis]